MVTPKRLRCGEQLKTTTCSRSAWWPGGKCPQHGYGATTFEEWARGLAAREEGPRDVALSVRAGERWDYAEEGEAIVSEHFIVWSVGGWSGRTWKYYARGSLTADETAVLADKLAAEGALDDDQMGMVWSAIADVLRKHMRERGDVARADAAAQALRNVGLTAMAVDNYVVLPLADAEALTAKLKILK